MNRTLLKQRAKVMIRGQVWYLFLQLLIIGAICGAGAGIIATIFMTGEGDVSVFGSLLLLAITIFVEVPLTFGYVYSYIRLFDHQRERDYNNIFVAFRDGRYWRLVGGFLLVWLKTFLWSLLFIIPGIIKGLSYSQTFYFMLEDDKISASEAIKKSKEVMDGHKWELFVLGLSFILWDLLVIVTCGFAGIFVYPYMMATFYVYHVALTKGKKIVERAEVAKKIAKNVRSRKAA